MQASKDVYQIHFATPGGEETGVLAAAYPLQLAVRVDPVRKMLIYDALDFMPRLARDMLPLTKGDVWEIMNNWRCLTQTEADLGLAPFFTPQDVLISHRTRQMVPNTLT
eukprot:scaffold15328_cov16-Prasinocladus_malaysianus.AAC.6